MKDAPELQQQAWYQLSTSVAVLKFFAELVDEEEVESFHEHATVACDACKTIKTRVVEMSLGEEARIKSVSLHRQVYQPVI